MADHFKSPSSGSKIWNPMNPYELSLCNNIPEPVSTANSPLAMLAEQVRRKRAESSRISPTPENSVIRRKGEPQKFPSHPSIATVIEDDDCALDLSTKNTRPLGPPKESLETSLPVSVITTAPESGGIVGPVFSLAKLHSDPSSPSDQSFSESPTRSLDSPTKSLDRSLDSPTKSLDSPTKSLDSPTKSLTDTPTKSYTEIRPKPEVSPKSAITKKSLSALRSSPLYKKRKLTPKCPLATAKRLKINPDLSQSNPIPRSPSPKRRKPSPKKKSPPKKAAGTPNSVVNHKHTGRKVKRMPSGEPIKWLKRTMNLPAHNNKKKSYKLLKKCTPCCIVLSKLPLQTEQKDLDLAVCSERFSDVLTNCNKTCWQEYGRVYSPWIRALHLRMKRLFAVLLWEQTPKFTSLRMEPLVKTPKPPKSQPRRGPSLESATPGKRRFFLLELKRKTILIPVVGNQMGERAFELDNPKNIGILYNIAASLQKSGDE